MSGITADSLNASAIYGGDEQDTIFFDELKSLSPPVDRYALAEGMWRALWQVGVGELEDNSYFLLRVTRSLPELLPIALTNTEGTEQGPFWLMLLEYSAGSLTVGDA
jgi:hypothetical protein